MIYFTAHTFTCVCHCRRAMFRVLGMYNFGPGTKGPRSWDQKVMGLNKSKSPRAMETLLRTHISFNLYQDS